MPLIAAAVCPHPPLIVPAVAAGAAGELDTLRAACDAAVDDLVAAGAQALIIVGAGERTRWLPSDAHGSFAPFGVSIDVPLAPGAACRSGRATLPLSVTVGAWLVARRSPGVPISAATVAADAGERDCAALAEQMRARPDRVGLLVMGDGSACRGEKAPGYDDPRAQPYDDGVAHALATADAAALRGLDPLLSAELLVAGRAPWHVLAAAADDGGADGGGVEGMTGSGTAPAWRAALTYYAAPYGVAYFVATWTRP